MKTLLSNMLKKLGFWPFVLSFTLPAMAMSELLMIIESYWLTGDPFARDLMIVGFITPAIVGLVLSIIAATLVQYLKQAEEEIKAHQVLLQNVIDESPDPIVIKDQEAKFILVNEACARLYGSTPNEMIGKDDGDYIPDKEQAESFRQNVKEIMSDGKTQIVYEDSVDVKTGEYRHFKSIKRPFKNTKGEPQILVIAHDMTKDITIQKELRQSKYYQQALLDNFPFLIWLKDKESAFLAVNRPFAEATGHSDPSSLIGKNDLDVWPQRLAMKYRKDDAYVRETLQKIDIEEQVEEQGVEKWIETYKAPVIDPDGSLLGTVGFARDITARKRDQEELTLLEHALDQIDESYYLIDASGRFIKVNDVACKVLGYNKEEFTQMIVSDVTVDLPKEEWPYHFEAVRKDGSMTFEASHRRKDGSTFPVEINANHVRHQDTSYLLTLVRDITERKHTEQKLRRQEDIMIAQSRHAAMGEMINMIAHQWRQPITVIAMGANNILADIELEDLDEKDCDHHARSILRQTSYLSKTIDDFRDFFRPDKEVEEITPEEVLVEARKIIGKSLENHGVSFNITNKSTHQIKTYSRELLQVYINLLKNAQEALIGHAIKDPWIDVLIEDVDDLIVTTICDNARGIDEAIIDKIFDPYFSTKDELNGTGLGLYMSKTIVQNHLKGMITVKSDGQGACFRISLPNKDRILGS